MLPCTARDIIVFHVLTIIEPVSACVKNTTQAACVPILFNISLVTCSHVRVFFVWGGQVYEISSSAQFRGHDGYLMCVCNVKIFF